MLNTKTIAFILLLIGLLNYSFFANQKDKDVLKNGQSITKSISKTDTHKYSLNLQKGQLVLLNMAKYDIGLSLTVIDSENYIIEQTNTNEVADFLIFYAHKNDVYKFIVKTIEGEEKAKGKYTLQSNIYTSKKGSKVEVIDKMLNGIYRKDFPGASVTILDKGKAVYEKSFGLASLEHSVPNTNKTVYELASVSKQFTAFAIAMLAEKGSLKLDDDVRKYIPELPIYKKKITIRQLVHHTSGLMDTESLADLVGYESSNAYMPDDVGMRLIKRQKKLLFTPGEQFQYSNIGYSLLAEIVKRVTGKPFSTWTKENLFLPLGMKDTYIRDNVRKVVKNQSTSYVKFSGSQKHIISPVNFAATGACCIRSSTEDMLKWIENLKTGKVGGKKVLKMVAERGVLNNGSKSEYAFGNFHTEHRGIKRISHLGLTGGFRTSLARFPKKDVSFLYLANDGEWKSYYIARKLYDIYLADSLKKKTKKYVEKKPVKTENKAPAKKDGFDKNKVKLTEFTGVFYAKEIITAYELNIRKGKLFIESIRYKPISLKPTKKDVFNGSEDFFERVEFMRNKKNKIIGFKAFNDEGSPSVYFEKLN